MKLLLLNEPFERKLKRLAKKYRSLSADLAPVIEQLETKPDLGISIGKDCYKIRIAIASKNKGKSGGARLITYVRIVNQTIFLMDIYDKSEQPDISEAELKYIIDLLHQ